MFARILGLVAIVGLSTTTATAQDKKKKGFHCEVKKDGKMVDLDDVKDRKACKKMKGKWVKDHDHDHGDGADHDHDE